MNRKMENLRMDNAFMICEYKNIAAYISGNLIGIIRVVGDGYSILYVQDIIVHPNYQRRGVGKQLLERIDVIYPYVYQKVLLTDNQSSSLCFYNQNGYSLSSEANCVAMIKIIP